MEATCLVRKSSHSLQLLGVVSDDGPGVYDYWQETLVVG